LENMSKNQYDEIDKKRQALISVREILKPFGDYIAVVEGASISNITRKGIIRELREKLIQYEILNGENPNHDWDDVKDK